MSTVTQYQTYEIRFEPESSGEVITRFETPLGELSARLGTLPDAASAGPEPTSDLGSTVVRSTPDPRSGSDSVTRDLVRVRRPNTTTGRQSDEKLGSQLFEALFPPAGRDLLARNVESLADQRHRGLILRLHFDLADPSQARLAQLPWELLFHPEQRRFLAHSDRTPIVRHLALPGKTPRFDLPRRLRILLVAASPVDLPALDLANELDRVRSSWEQDNVEVTILGQESDHETPGPDLAARLRETLRRDEFHVLHFMGHGAIDPETRSGVLYFPDASGRSSRVTGEQLARWLSNHRTLRLVVLNACNTGQVTEGFEPFLGVAPTLVRSGIPGVLAMQQPMPDTMAIEFSRVLYQSLANGTSVEAALSQARLELHALRPEDRLWSTPVLFERDPQILRIPPKVGPALSKTWTAFGLGHAVLVTILFLRNRGIPALPNMRTLLGGDASALLAVILGLPLFYVLLYTTQIHIANVKLPKPAAAMSPIRRLCHRLPVAFQARIQGRRFVESLYQGFFLITFLVAPMVLQGHFYVRTIKAETWIRHDTAEMLAGAPARYVPLASGWEQFLTYAPLVEGLTDNFRIGKVDTREHVRNELDNLTYLPFYQPWGLLLAETIAACWLAVLLWRLVQAERPRKARER